MKRFLASFIAVALAILGGLAAIFKYRGDKYQTEAKHEKERADTYQEVIDDVETIKRVHDDPAERDRVRDKYQRD